MARFKEGDRVLVEARVYSPDFSGFEPSGYFIDPDGGGDRSWAHLPAVHVHPGVPVEDLLEELELLWSMWYGTLEAYVGADEHNRAIELREAREAAQRPEYEPGDEVWVRARVACRNGDQYAVDFSTARPNRQTVGSLHPDDIRPVEEET